ncbi:MAG: glycosyltransferase family 4 protein [Cyclobacteriaceae bacterium]
MNRVLVITYYWPPSGGVGVQRWLKMSKYLPDYGWEPVIFTPENPQFNIRDESLLQEVRHETEVLRFPIREPFGIFNKLSGNKKNVKQGLALEKSDRSFIDKAAVWVRGNLFVPDPRRFWVRPASKFLTDFLPQNGIDTIITTGPPHSMHLIGLELKKKHPGLKWVADLRDPWSEWDMLDKLRTGSLAKGLHRRYEKMVLKQADIVLTVSKGMGEDLASLGGGNRVRVITNGFDQEDLAEEQAVKKGDTFRITHLGLLNELRDPQAIFTAISDLCRENEAFNESLELELGGIISQSVRDRLMADPILKNKIEWHDYLPREEVIRKYSKASVLLLLQNRTEKSRHILPAKLFEYLPTGKPVLLSGLMKSDAATLLQETGVGLTVAYDDAEGSRLALRELFEKWHEGSLQKSDLPGKVAEYSRNRLTGKLASLLDELNEEA